MDWMAVARRLAKMKDMNRMAFFDDDKMEQIMSMGFNARRHKDAATIDLLELMKDSMEGLEKDRE